MLQQVGVREEKKGFSPKILLLVFIPYRLNLKILDAYIPALSISLWKIWDLSCCVKVPHTVCFIS